MDTAEQTGGRNQSPEKALTRSKRSHGMISKMELYRTVALHANCSVGFVSQVDHGYRSNGVRTRRVVAALEAAYEAAKNIELAIMAALN